MGHTNGSATGSTVSQFAVAEVGLERLINVSVSAIGAARCGIKKVWTLEANTSYVKYNSCCWSRICTP